MVNALVIAHRGARSLAPENTLAAARAAWEVGADGWELDVQLTRDGQIVLMHDESLARTTDARHVFPDRSPWKVGDLSLEEIRMLDAGSWFVHEDPFGTIRSGEVAAERGALYSGEPVPTLREALLLSKELGLWVNIELKGAPLSSLSPGRKALVDGVVALVRELEVERVLLSSFDHEMIRYAKALGPEIPGALLVLSVNIDPVVYLRGVGADALNSRFTAYDPVWAAALRDAGFGVFVWTVNETADLLRFSLEPSVSGIITDWPQRLRALLDRGG